jgi:general stress protein 26
MNQDGSTLLTWEFVQREMTGARNYWLSTSTNDGTPHVAPVWGIWLDDRLYFDGSGSTKWGRNLANDPRIAVHLPDPERVVVVEGIARMLGDNDLTDDEWSTLDSTYRHKYSVDEGSPFRYVEPTKVLAWDGDDLQNMTRWIFT